MLVISVLRLSADSCQRVFLNRTFSKLEIYIQAVTCPMVSVSVKGHWDSNEVPTGKIASSLCLDRPSPCQSQSTVAGRNGFLSKGWHYFKERNVSNLSNLFIYQKLWNDKGERVKKKSSGFAAFCKHSNAANHLVCSWVSPRPRYSWLPSMGIDSHTRSLISDFCNPGD